MLPAGTTPASSTPRCCRPSATTAWATRCPSVLRMVGGALRGRAAVTLIDAARDHLTDADIVRAWTLGGPKSSPG